MNQRALALMSEERIAESLDSLLKEETLAELLDDGAFAVPQGLGDRALLGGLREFVARPGRQLRRRLVEIGWRLGGGCGRMPSELGDLVELVHAGSLIVDDIEDDADERRGKPAMHRQHGVPVALNGGNLLYFLPLLRVQRLGLPRLVELSIFRSFTATMVRCHYGQALDLGVRVWNLPRRQVPPAVSAATRLKTGSLTEFAMLIGASSAGGDEPVRRAVARLGRDLGIALQMMDDLSGLTNRHRIQKGREDLRFGRLTWPWAWAASRLDERSYAQLRSLARRATASRPPASGRASERRTSGRASDGDAPRLDPVIEHLRAALGGRGRWHVRAHVRAAMGEAQKVFGRSNALSALAHEIANLEKSYG